MLVSYKLLNSICPKLKSITIKQFCEACLSVGIEVEKVTYHPHTEGLKLVKIIDIQKHPNADKLSLVTITYDQKVIQVVCGASNLIIDFYAIYAPLNTRLHNGLEISKRKIRDIESCGMLCSYAEITNINPELLDEKDIDGIVLFSPKQLSSKNIQQLLNLDDVIIDVTLPSNRNDLNALVCFCQEICAFLKIDFKNDFVIENDYRQTNFIKKINMESKISQNIGYIKVEDIPQYETTWSEKEILCSSGYKVHNNWLDFFNLTTIINGNPISVYDYDKLGSINQLNIRPTLQDLEIIDSDKKCLIPKGSIAVYNGTELINVPGILSISKYAYTQQTKNIMIEVANLHHLHIRHSAEKMKIANRNIQLFSKPISSWITINTYNSLYNFFSNITSKVAINILYSPHIHKVVKLDVEDFNRFIGMTFKAKAIFDILISLNFLVDETGEVIVHPARLDIENAYDLYEEILKIVNINKLPMQDIDLKVLDINRDCQVNRQNNLRNYWINNGFVEVKTYNLTSLEEAHLFNFNCIDEFVKINNPISKIREVVRVSLINDLLKVLKYNQSYKRQIYNVFEIQQLLDKNKKVYQNLGMVFYGDILKNKLTDAIVDNNIQNVESLIYNLFQSFNIEVAFAKINDLQISQIYNDQLIGVYHNMELLGYIGTIKNSILKQYDLNLQTICVSLKIDSLLNYQASLFYQPVSTYPLVIRDVNFEIEKSSLENFEKFLVKIRNIANIQSANIKDVFYKNNLVVITICLEISSNTGTMTIEEIEAIISDVKKLKELIML